MTITTTPIKSRKVRTIIKLDAQADTLFARYQARHERCAPLLERVGRLRMAVEEIESTLTGGQLAELRRVRNNGRPS